MKINDSFYPYPVLASFNDDYLNSKFEVEYAIEENEGENTLIANFSLDEPSLDQLIKEGLACFLLHIECTQTAYRRIVQSNENILKFDIDAKQLRGKVDLNSLIVVNGNRIKLSSININPLYQGREFYIDYGDVIAASLTRTLNIEDSINDFKSMASIMKVAFSKAEYMEIDIDSDLIYVRLPEKQYNGYVKFSKSKYQNLILSAVIFPALIQVLNLMSKLFEESSSLKWFQVIEDRLTDMNLEIESINRQVSAVEVAQMILQNPLERAFEDIRVAIENEEISDED